MKPLLIDCSFDRLPALKDPAQVLTEHATGFGYAKYLQQKMRIIIIEHLKNENKIIKDGVQYHFFKSNKRWNPFFVKMTHFIKNEQPDIVLIQGLVFPLELILLRLQLHNKVIFLAQHHGEIPAKGLKKFLQKSADYFINGYLFTSLDNATVWIDEKIIAGYHKCFEILEASTFLKKQDKLTSVKKLKLQGNPNFLWVGRLNPNKDPITVLSAFEEYINVHGNAMLYMIYQEETLLPEIKLFIETNPVLKNSVVLCGKITHENLGFWYSASDFFIAGSHREGSGYALLEAMACGCIPIVTDIPSFRKILDFGKYGFLYPPGNSHELSLILQSLDQMDQGKLSSDIMQYFSEELSFRSIADNLYRICQKMLPK